MIDIENPRQEIQDDRSILRRIQNKLTFPPLVVSEIISFVFLYGHRQQDFDPSDYFRQSIEECRLSQRTVATRAISVDSLWLRM